MPYATRKQLLRFAQDAIRAYRAGDACPVMPSSWAGSKKWPEAYTKLQEFWAGELGYKVFAKGNDKLPFWAFSTLPIITCPGMGECGVTPTGKFGYCYSLKAFRYPHAFMRQLVNTLRLISPAGMRQLTNAFYSLPIGATVRLYVDGDIDSKATMRFWFGLISTRQDMPVYGYSKSWQLFLDWHDSGRQFPPNYILNLSGGSKYDGSKLERMRRLPIVRGHDSNIAGAGEFLAFKSSVKMPAGETSAEIKSASNWAAYGDSLRAAAAAAGMPKIWVCPGKCGDCMGNGKHACGAAEISLPIVIGLH